MTSLLTKQLLDRSRASLAPAVHIPDFFSSEDIRAVESLKQEHHARLGKPRPARRNWNTTYLNADGLFRSRRPQLYNRLCDLRFRVDLTPFGFGSTTTTIDDDDSTTNTTLLLKGLNVRCIELHEGGKGGSLNDPKHYDNGSVVTADILLDDDFTGGEFTTLEDEEQTHKAHLFSRGDALVFPSYKYHSVAPITSGLRSTLVIEFWNHAENLSNHRGFEPQPPPDDDVPINIQFSEAGTLGLVFAFEDAIHPGNTDAEKIRDGRPVVARVTGVRDGTQAAAKKRQLLLTDINKHNANGNGRGVMLTHVNGLEVVGMGFDALDSIIAKAALGDVRPVELMFVRHHHPVT